MVTQTQSQATATNTITQLGSTIFGYLVEAVRATTGLNQEAAPVRQQQQGQNGQIVQMDHHRQMAIAERKESKQRLNLLRAQSRYNARRNCCGNVRNINRGRPNYR